MLLNLKNGPRKQQIKRVCLSEENILDQKTYPLFLKVDSMEYVGLLPKYVF